MDSLMGDPPIAGVTRAIGAPIVTRNLRDFEPFEGISAEEY